MNEDNSNSVKSAVIVKCANKKAATPVLDVAAFFVAKQLLLNSRD